MSNFLFIKKDGQYLQISPTDIVYIENVKRYARVITHKKTYLVFSSLNNIIKELPGDIFCRIHQSYIVSLIHLESFNNEFVCVTKKQIPIGRQYRNLLLEKIGILNCDKGNKYRSSGGDIDSLLREIEQNR